MTKKQFQNVLTAALFSLISASVFGQTLSRAQMADLNREFLEKFRAEDYKAALKIGDQLARATPNSPTAPYNNACVYAKMGNKDQAFAALRRAVDLGFPNVTLIKTDSDLDSLRDDPRFDPLVKQCEKQVKGDLDLAAKEAKFYFPGSLKPNQPARAVVVLHGFGGNAAQSIELWKEVADREGVAIIAPRAPAVATRNDRGGFRWTSRQDTEKIINKAIETAKSKHKIDDQRLILAGFSQGGMMTYVVGLNQGHRFAGLIPVAGRFIPEQISPPDVAKDKMAKVFIMVGENDHELSSNKAAAEAFKEWDIRHELHVYPDTGHAYPENRTEELTKALQYIWEYKPRS